MCKESDSTGEDEVGQIKIRPYYSGTMDGWYGKEKT